MSIFIGLALLVIGFAVASSGPAGRTVDFAESRLERTSGPAARPGAGSDPFPDGAGRAHRQSADSVPLLLELLGAMLQAGLALPRALEIAARTGGEATAALARAAAALELGVDWNSAWPDEPEPNVEQIRAALQFAATTGAPSAELLFAHARQLRRTRHRDLEKRAAALGVRLVVPLGVCSLPAFLCLGVVPVLLAMMPGG